MKNKVELIGYYGDDRTIALSAWTSTSRDLTPEKEARIPNLIKMLWTEGHETPFEKASVHFLLTVDQASHIHLLKHRIASINAESARYKELKEDNYYLPEDWDSEWIEKLRLFTVTSNHMYHKCLQDLTPKLGRKRAKETARYFKAFNSQITMDVQFNMRSFANFLKLRWSEHAQVEIREIARQMFELVQAIEGDPFKETLKQINPYV